MVFHFSPFSVFHSPFSGVFIFHLFQSFIIGLSRVISSFNFFSFFASAADLRNLFLLSVVFYLTLLPTFATVSRVLRIWESFFYSHAFFTLHSLPKFDITCFYQGFPGAGSFSLKVAGPPTKVRNTDPVHLFVWITQFSAKDISR